MRDDVAPGPLTPASVPKAPGQPQADAEPPQRLGQAPARGVASLRSRPRLLVLRRGAPCPRRGHCRRHVTVSFRA